MLVASTDIASNLRQTLSGIATKRQSIAEMRDQLQQFKQQRAQAADDEKRLRDNIAVLGSEPTLRKRMLDQFSDAETTIEKLDATIASQSAALAKAEQDLRSSILALTL